MAIGIMLTRSMFIWITISYVCYSTNITLSSFKHLWSGRMYLHTKLISALLHLARASKCNSSIRILPYAIHSMWQVKMNTVVCLLCLWNCGLQVQLLWIKTHQHDEWNHYRGCHWETYWKETLWNCWAEVSFVDLTDIFFRLLACTM